MGQEAPASSRRVITGGQWAVARYDWCRAVRSDARLQPVARLIATALALDYANAQTAKCSPGFGELARVHGVSAQTVKRAVRELERCHWIVREPGDGRGHGSRYAFLSRAEIVPIKGGMADPLSGRERGSAVNTFEGDKGGHGRSPSDDKGGHGCPERGSPVTPPYNIAKPCKKIVRRRDGSAVLARLSENPLVASEAERAVGRLRDGRTEALDDLAAWVLGHVVAAGLLTDAELEAAGLGIGG